MPRSEVEYIPRKLERVLIQELKTSPAVALTGPRQSGKSTLLKQIFGKTYSIISFDDPLVQEKAVSDPKRLIKAI